MGVQNIEIRKDKAKDEVIDKKQQEIDEKHKGNYVNGRLIPVDESIFVEETLNGLLQYCKNKMSKNFFKAGKQEQQIIQPEWQEKSFVNILT